jgi:hypothetical protein
MLHQPSSLPFAFPGTYLLLSKYMLLMRFVIYCLALSDLLCLTLLTANLWMEQRLMSLIIKKPLPDDPHDLLPKQMHVTTPSTQFLWIALLAIIMASDTITVLGLRTNQNLKLDLHRYHGSSGFLMPNLP